MISRWFINCCDFSIYILGTKCFVIMYDSCMLCVLIEQINKGASLCRHVYVFARQLIRMLFVYNMFVRQSERWWMWPYYYVFKCLLTFFLITSAGEGDADTWMMSMILVRKGVEVCGIRSVKFDTFQHLK